MEYFILALLGLSFGSFLNVCIYRIPRGISVITRRSFCTSCNTQLRWFELIPLVSFIAQKGKCRSCSHKISFYYPFVEIVSAVIFVSLYYKFGISTTYAELVIFFSIALIIAFVDWEHLIIPNSVLLTGFVLLLGVQLFDPESWVIEQLLSGIVSGLLMLLVLQLGNYFLKKESMGMGDVKLSGLIGFVIGLPLFLVSVWISSILGTIYSVVRKSKEKVKIPFGAILISVSAVFLLFREQIEEYLLVWIN